MKDREAKQRCFRALSEVVYLRRLASETQEAFLARARALLETKLADFPANFAQYIRSRYLPRIGAFLKCPSQRIMFQKIATSKPKGSIYTSFDP